MQALKFMTAHRLNYFSPLMSDNVCQFRINDSMVDTDNSSSPSPRNDFDCSSRRSSPFIKSDRGSEDDDYDDGDETLSVGTCESPPPSVTSENLKITLAESHHSLKFSIDNILRPEFGERNRQSKKRASQDSPVDLSKECSEAKNTKTEENGASSKSKSPDGNTMWPAWVYCTRYSDRPSSGPRVRVKRSEKRSEEKRPRTAFTGEQLARLKKEFNENNYLTEKRRQELAQELGLHEAQIKIWFQNKRAKIKKASGTKNPLALKLMAEGLYNHSTLGLNKDEKDD